jgi:hypothetical protein
MVMLQWKAAPLYLRPSSSQLASKLEIRTRFDSEIGVNLCNLRMNSRSADYTDSHRLSTRISSFSLAVTLRVVRTAATARFLMCRIFQNLVGNRAEKSYSAGKNRPTISVETKKNVLKPFRSREPGPVDPFLFRVFSLV